MSYQKKLKSHLVDYKLRHLGISQPGVFLYRGREVWSHHILPLADYHRNLFEEAKPAAMAFLKQNRGKRHRYFHHLNSSQAFAFNLFFPYFYGGPAAASALLRVLGREGVLIKCEPEAVPDPDEESNIDMLWVTEDGVQTLCEIKLSETDFGKVADDARHRKKFKDYYEDVLPAHLEPGRLDLLAFFDAYQFNRNVWHMARVEKSQLIFLLPKANVVLRMHLDELLVGVAPSTRNRISAVCIEDVIAKLSTDERCPTRLRQYANKLKQKYVP